MKSMKPRNVRECVLVIYAIGLFLAVIGTKTSDILVVIGLGVMICGAIFHVVCYRCPYCGKFLDRSTGEYCPACGKKLDGQKE